MAIVKESDFQPYDHNESRRKEGPEAAEMFACEQLEVVCEAYKIHSRCFLCGAVLTTPYVIWMGQGITKGESRYISLHPNCVESLFKRMMRDVNEINNKQGE